MTDRPRNIIGWHIAAADLVNSAMSDVCETSAIIKVLVEPHSAYILGWVRDFALRYNNRPLIVGRLISHDQEERELHRRAWRQDDVNEVSRWYADIIASIAIPQQLKFVIWESGPNELNAEGDLWWARYSEHFLFHMRQHGLRCALGSFSVGRPKLPMWDGIDEWVTGGWLPIMQAIHEANVGPRQAGESPDPVAYFDMHAGNHPGEVFKEWQLRGGRHDYLYNTHIKPNGWFVPLIFSEWAYWPPGGPYPNTEERIEQMLHINAKLGRDDYIAGVCMFQLGTREDAETEVRHLVAPYAQAMRTGGFINRHPMPPKVAPTPKPAPQPRPEPPSDEYPYRAVVDTSGGNLNLRAGATTKSITLVKMPDGSEVEVIDRQGAWRKVRYTTTYEGWAHSDYLTRRD